MLLTAALGLTGLSNHPFWDDEANTAIYGRNLLKFGRLTAWDGQNLVGYAYGGALGEDLGKELRVPALPACVAAIGMRLAGETTFGGRVMFVIAGIASVGLLAIWMRRLFGRRVISWRMLGAVVAAAVIVAVGVTGMDYMTQRQWARKTGPVLADAERVLVRLVYVKNETEPQRLARARDEVRRLNLASRLGEVRSSAAPRWARDLTPLTTTFSLMAEAQPLPERVVHRLSDGGLLSRASRLREMLAREG